jgi:type I restriction enzyme M protein
MITGDLKNKIDKIWEIFWTGGLTNPLSVIEQLTYLLFIKGLDEAQKRQESEVQMLGGDLINPPYVEATRHLRWSSFKELGAEQMYQTFARQDESNPGAFQYIKSLGGKASSFAKYMKDAIFMIPTPRMLERVVSLLDAIPMEDREKLPPLVKMASSAPRAI